MCKSMTDFEELVQKIQDMKATRKELDNMIDNSENELKAYMKKRQKEELQSKTTGLTVSYKSVSTPRFNKELFIKNNNEAEYKKYVVSVPSMRLNYLKQKCK